MIGLIALLAGAVLEARWLAGAGVFSAGASDVLGLLQARTRFNLPVERAWRGAAEWLPALGVAAYHPYALLACVSIVLFALFASGMQTVSLARGVPLKMNSGETLRRILTSLSSLLLLTIPLGMVIDFDFSAWAGSTPHALAVVAGAVVALAGVRALLDMLISVKLGSQPGKTPPSPNVDT